MKQKLEKTLATVEKPARYIGGEWNSIKKNWIESDVKMVFAFPDLYEVGMSHLGMQIIYRVVNDRSDALMERTFAPWIDMEKKMRNEGIALFSIESWNPVKKFDIIGFTLQYEMSYTNILNMLDLSGIPIHSNKREDDMPLVIAGGPCSFNPEPLAPFIDVFLIGEGEEIINQLLDVYIKKKKEGKKKNDILINMAGIKGVYVPLLYEIEYYPNEAVKNMSCPQGVSPVVQKGLVQDFDKVKYPTRPIVPHTEIIHDRMMLEVMRGCTRGCRFCQAGIIYRPVREKNPETLMMQAEELVRNTGWEEISLTSLSSSDYSRIEEIITGLVNRYEEEMINIALPSLRVDAFSVDLAKEVQKVRRSSLTFAPEAGTQRLRDVINKGVAEEDLMEAVTSAFKSGWNSIKLYFMIGLPTEIKEDLEGIARLAKKILSTGRDISKQKNRVKVTVSISSFVPKSHTPFQWEPQNSIETLIEKQNFLKQELKSKGLAYNWHEAKVSLLEADISRGNRKMAKVIENAWLMGCRFDGWTEQFDMKKWSKAFADCNLEPGHFAYRSYDYDDILPWEHINTGVSKRYLAREHKKAIQGITTKDCREGQCPGCGLCPSLEIKPSLAGGEIIVPVQDTI